MRTSTVLSLPVQLVFPGWGFTADQTLSSATRDFEVEVVKGILKVIKNGASMYTRT
jgi:hypothetical protein